MRAKLSIALSALAAMMWAVPSTGTAHFTARTAIDRPQVRSERGLPRPVRFRVQKERGLLLRAWINGSGPFIFVVDTGAGVNVITDRVVNGARLPVQTVGPTAMGGLTANRTSSDREAVISRIALGDQNNVLPSNKLALIVSYLPPDIDGILDPTEAYSPYGYSIDLPHQWIEALDTTGDAFQSRSAKREGAIVSWLHIGKDNRPFVRLGDGRLALVDTGSGFGLAVNERNAVIIGNHRGNQNSEGIRDIGGGTISSRRVSPTTISIGELVLRRVPTDILFGIEDDAPVILGRDALYPFKITFDPHRRLIEFATSAED
jgi:hypothetical protein